MIAVLTVLLLSGPAAVVELPAACEGVAAEVIELDADFELHFAPAEADAALPSPREVRSFFETQPLLEQATADYDALARDLLFVRLQQSDWEDVKEAYADLDEKVLRDARVRACEHAIIHSSPVKRTK